MSSPTTKIPPGAWVVVTGASGFLASHICFQLLKRGFKVRGTVRNPSESSWLLKGRFEPYADVGDIRLFSVPDLGTEGAYDEIVKGAAAVIHTAYVTDIVPNPNKVITPMVAGVRSIMNAAMREPSVKEVVFTSSGLTASPLTRGVDNGIIGRDSWNNAVLEAAWAPPPYGMSHAMANYPASKVAAEKEVWKFVEQESLHFNVNVVSPAGLIGEPLNRKHVEGQANWGVHAYRGNKAVMDTLQASFYVDVKDVALIHVAAILDPEVKSARLQCWGHSAHWNEFLAILRRLRPEKELIEDYSDPHHIQVSVDQSESVALMKRWSAQPDKCGWTSLENSIFENITNPYLEG